MVYRIKCEFFHVSFSSHFLAYFTIQYLHISSFDDKVKFTYYPKILFEDYFMD